MFHINFKKHTLNFHFEAGTSRGILQNHTVYYIILQHSSLPNLGIGECAPLKGLSIDYEDDLTPFLSAFTTKINSNSFFKIEDVFNEIEENKPALRFAVETAWYDLKNGGKRMIFQNDFSTKEKPIKINGLIWMADKKLMLSRIKEKLTVGFDTLKLKVGAINFDEEIELLTYIRQQFTAKDLTIRLDANGAFEPSTALEKLKQLSDYEIHSIEQPIKNGQPESMKNLCTLSPIPIALDEELIGIKTNEAENLINHIKPQYLIFKPTLLGGIAHVAHWINIAEKTKIKWWITSALESNIGLNAIAQFTAQYNNNLPQGLGTGQLYSNNIESPLTIIKDSLIYKQNIQWNLAILNSTL